MHISCKTLWLQKDGNAAEDYEDAAYPTAFVEEDADSFRCAIADGATESSFSGLWSNILVQGLVYGSDLLHLRKEFVARLGTKQLPWYAEEKLQAGAFAAVVLLSLKTDDDGVQRWESEAIGDSCIMHVRENQLMTSFPLDKPESFNNSPVLLSTTGESTEQSEALLHHSGEWQAGDSFWLMTDAIACWTLKRLRDYDDAFEMLDRIEDLDAFKEFVASQRAIIDEEGRSTLKNDDVTVIRVLIS